MSKYEMTGILFKNDKVTSEKSPAYKGKATVDGVEYWLAAWVNEGDKGKYLSIKFEVQEDKDKPKAKIADMKDDLPF